MNSLIHVLKLVLLGLVLGVMLTGPALRIEHNLNPGTPLRGFLIGEMTVQSVQGLAMEFLLVPYGSDVDVYINSPGGDVTALDELLMVAKFNNIHVHAIVIGPSWVASAAAVFLVHSDTMQIDPAAILVFHLGYVSLDGKNLTKLNVNEKDPILQVFANSMAEMIKIAVDKCVITSDEYTRVLNGEDVFVGGREALNNMANCH